MKAQKVSLAFLFSFESHETDLFLQRCGNLFRVLYQTSLLYLMQQDGCRSLVEPYEMLFGKKLPILS